MVALDNISSSIYNTGYFKWFCLCTKSDMPLPHSDTKIRHDLLNLYRPILLICLVFPVLPKSQFELTCWENQRPNLVKVYIISYNITFCMYTNDKWWNLISIYTVVSVYWLRKWIHSFTKSVFLYFIQLKLNTDFANIQFFIQYLRSQYSISTV